MMLSFLRFFLFPCLMVAAVSLVRAADDDPLRARAESGDAAAQLRLADEYFYGTPGRKANYTLAAHWFRVLAERGVPAGMFNYALCLDQGFGVERDPFQAAGWYRKAAASGTVPQAVFNHALILLNGIPCRDEHDRSKFPPGYPVGERHESEGMALLSELAEKNFAPARTELAERLLRSKNLSASDRRRIFSLLSVASASPDAPPKVWRMLADCYYGGIGVAPDNRKMMDCLIRSAGRGDPEGVVKLAYCYEHGLNTEPDAAKALLFYKKGAAMGIGLAQYQYALRLERGEVPGAGLTEAVEWYRKAAAQNDAAAYFRMSELTAEGRGVPRDEKLSASLLFHAAKLGHLRAQFRLALLFREKNGVLAPDPTAVFYWFKQAAERGDPASQRELAVCFYNGEGCEKSSSEGDKWLRRAASGGDIPAQRMLVRSSRSPW